MHPGLGEFANFRPSHPKTSPIHFYPPPPKKTLLEQQYDDFMGVLTPVGTTIKSSLKTIIDWIQIPKRTEPLAFSNLVSSNNTIPIHHRLAHFIYSTIASIPPHLAFFFICFTYILYWTYLKIKYPFWNLQPVYHTYDIMPRWHQVPYLVNRGFYLPKTKYCDNQFLMTTYEYDSVSADKFSLVLDILKCHYIPTDNAYFTINRRQLDAYHSGQNRHSYLTFYSELEYSNMDLSGEVSPAENTENNNNNTLLPGYKEAIQGVVMSRPANLYLWNVQLNEYVLWESNYVDFLCTHRENKKTRHLFQTHVWNSYAKSPDVKVAIFKKEVDLCDGVIPLVKYKTYMFHLEKQKAPALPAGFSIIQIKTENLDILANTLKHIDMRRHQAILAFNVGYYISLIRAKMLHIYCLVQQDIVYGIYMLRETNIEYDTAKEPIGSIQCVSLQNIKNNELFYLGFLNALYEFKKTFQHRVLVLENVGSNCILVERSLKYKTPLSETETAYYTHNLIVPGTPFAEENVVYLV